MFGVILNFLIPEYSFHKLFKILIAYILKKGDTKISSIYKRVWVEGVSFSLKNGGFIGQNTNRYKICQKMRHCV